MFIETLFIMAKSGNSSSDVLLANKWQKDYGILIRWTVIQPHKIVLLILPYRLILENAK